MKDHGKVSVGLSLRGGSIVLTSGVHLQSAQQLSVVTKGNTYLISMCFLLN